MGPSHAMHPSHAMGPSLASDSIHAINLSSAVGPTPSPTPPGTAPSPAQSSIVWGSAVCPCPHPRGTHTMTLVTPGAVPQPKQLCGFVA